MGRLIDERGFQIGACDGFLADVLGRASGEVGFNVLSQTAQFGRKQVELRDWLYCLALSQATLIRERLIDSIGQSAATFVKSIEGGFAADQGGKGLPPAQLTSTTVTAEVLAMLDRAEQLAEGTENKRVSDGVLTLAILETAGARLKQLLTLWATDEGLATFIETARRSVKKPVEVELFSDDSELNWKAFSPSGRQFCKRLVEDATSLGAKKISSRHVLYSLLSNEAGLLTIALSVQGVDVKGDLHSRLVLELSRVGLRRVDNVDLNRDNMFDPVVSVLQAAAESATSRGEQEIAEFDIHRAFALKQLREITRLIPSERPLDQGALLDYIKFTEPADEDPELAQTRFTVKAIEQNIRETLFGQEAAISAVIPWVKRLRYGLPRDGRPAAVFLFLGPTGTGKTQMAKELARYVFGNENDMLFLEMTHYKTRESMSGLIGAPPGYIGYGDGKLTNGLRDNSECVVLFDEIEKADTEVFDVILRFADEGLISDPAGPVRDGRRCIIIMTTNAGQTWLREHLAKYPNAREKPEELSKLLFDAAMQELQEKKFRPEFLGRVDDRITFLPFNEEVCAQIIKRVLEGETDRLLEIKNVTLDVDEDVEALLASSLQCRSIDEGARAAPRVVNSFIVTPAIDLLVGDDDEEDGPMRARTISVCVAGDNKLFVKCDDRLETVEVKPVMPGREQVK